MKITLTTVILLSSCFWSADSCGRGRTSVGARGYARSNYGRVEGRVTHEWDRGSTWVSGSVDTNKDWEVGVGVKVQVGKRSVQWFQHYNITLKADPCNFNTYDNDRDGAIVKEELQAIFGNNEKTDALFKDMDITTDDGDVVEEEFYAMAPVIIAGCLDTPE